MDAFNKINIGCYLHNLSIDFYCFDRMCNCRKKLCSVCKNNHRPSEQIVPLKSMKQNINSCVDRNHHMLKRQENLKDRITKVLNAKEKKILENLAEVLTVDQIHKTAELQEKLKQNRQIQKRFYQNQSEIHFLKSLFSRQIIVPYLYVQNAEGLKRMKSMLNNLNKKASIEHELTKNLNEINWALYSLKNVRNDFVVTKIHKKIRQIKQKNKLIINS